MKSPIKFDWMPLIAFSIGGIPATALIYFLLSWLPVLLKAQPASSNYPSAGTFLLIPSYLLFVIFGFLMSWAFTDNNIYHRKAKHPVDHKNLVIGNIYFLNNETYATFIGVDAYSKVYYFAIYGVDKLAPTPVHESNLEYFSAEQEIEEDK